MSEPARIARFIAIGLLNTLFGYASYTLFVLLSVPLWLALVGSILATFAFNFITYGGLVFKDLSRQNLPRFLLFYSALATVNYIALRLLESEGVKPILGQAMLLPLFAAAILGGIGSAPGAFAGALIIGFGEAITVELAGAEWRAAVAFLVLIAVLVVRPTGLARRPS